MTRRDRLLGKVLRYTKSGWPATVSEALKPYQRRQDEISTEDDCLLWGSRVIVPLSLQESILQELHTLVSPC